MRPNDEEIAPAEGNRPKEPYVCAGKPCSSQHYPKCGHHVSWRHGTWRPMKAPSFLGGEIEGPHVVYICPCEADK